MNGVKEVEEKCRQMPDIDHLNAKEHPEIDILKMDHE